MVNRPFMYPIVALATIALLGVLLLQSYWLLQAFHRNQTVFQGQIEAALLQVSEFIDPGDALFGRIEALTNPQRPPVQQEAAYAAETLRLVREKLDTVLPEVARAQAYSLALFQDEPDGLFYTDAASTDIQDPGYRVPLHRVCFTCNVYLGVSFPELSALYFVRPIAPLLGVSYLFVLILLGCFTYTLWALHRLGKQAARQMAFVNNMTHEYQTPLFTISVAARLLQEAEPLRNEAALLQHVQVIERARERLTKHTEQILNLAHLESEPLALRKAPVNVHTLIEDAITLFRPLIEQAGGSITTACRAQHPTVYADPEHLAYALHNLIDNARKYTDGVPTVTISTADAADGLLLAVEDKGLGIEKSQQARIFEKFYRVSTGDRHDVKGFGLGLSVVKETLRLHGGRITVESQPGNGSRFTLIIPRTSP